MNKDFGERECHLSVVYIYAEDFAPSCVFLLLNKHLKEQKRINVTTILKNVVKQSTTVKSQKNKLNSQNVEKTNESTQKIS